MLRVLVMGSDVQSELALLQRLQFLSGLPGSSMALSYDLADCNLMVVANSGAMPQAARRMVARRPDLPLWLLDQDGELHDALQTPDQPIAKDRISHVLRDLSCPAPAKAAEPELFVERMRASLASGEGFGAVSLDGDDVLYLDFKKGIAVPSVLTRLPAERVPSWLGASFSRLSLRSATDADFAEAALKSHRLPLAPLLWQTALRMQADPQLIGLLKEETVVRLRHWPDFRVLGNRHDDFRLCSLLLKRACTWRECSHMLGVDPGAVKAFFNAAYLSGYAIAAAAPTGTVARPAGTVSQQGSVLANMWRSMRGRIGL